MFNIITPIRSRNFNTTLSLQILQLRRLKEAIRRTYFYIMYILLGPTQVVHISILSTCKLEEVVIRMTWDSTLSYTLSQVGAQGPLFIKLKGCGTLSIFFCGWSTDIGCSNWVFFSRCVLALYCSFFGGSLQMRAIKQSFLWSFPLPFCVPLVVGLR